MIGHDNADLLRQIDNLPVGLPDGFSRLQREWLADETGDVGDVKLSFDISGLDGFTSADPLDYRILIDEDGDGDFQTGTVVQIDPDNINGDVLEFDNISFSNDGGGKDIFTFAVRSTITWNGSVDSDWSNPANWDGGAVPTEFDSVEVPDVTNDPEVGSSMTGVDAAKCLNLNVQSGANLTVNGELILTEGN